ncbi:hypothetical protein FACS1894109_08520 [Spirochaetia bacterium]|nr:hypothetical protein FACS1894109_08520 [Spirochaetia bacterium]
MRRKLLLVSLGAVLVFLNLAVFTVFGEPIDGINDSEGKNEQVQINNIPGDIKTGVPAYKIYIQLSTGMTAKAGYAAKGEALINGKTSVIIDLKKPDGQPWSDMGNFNFAITISPKEVSTAKDILVHGGEKHFSSQNPQIAWTGLINLHEIVPAQVEEIFEGVIKPDTAIIKK